MFINSLIEDVLDRQRGNVLDSLDLSFSVGRENLLVQGTVDIRRTIHSLENVLDVRKTVVEFETLKDRRRSVRSLGPATYYFEESFGHFRQGEKTVGSEDTRIPHRRLTQHHPMCRSTSRSELCDVGEVRDDDRSSTKRHSFSHRRRIDCIELT